MKDSWPVLWILSEYTATKDSMVTTGKLSYFPGYILAKGHSALPEGIIYKGESAPKQLLELPVGLSLNLLTNELSKHTGHSLVLFHHLQALGPSHSLQIT